MCRGARDGARWGARSARAAHQPPTETVPEAVGHLPDGVAGAQGGQTGARWGGIDAPDACSGGGTRGSAGIGLGGAQGGWAKNMLSGGWVDKRWACVNLHNTPTSRGPRSAHRSVAGWGVRVYRDGV